MPNEEIAANSQPIAIPDERPLDIQFGFDVDRMWATSAQVYGNNSHYLIIFREQTGTSLADGTLQMLMRNVGSVVMPTEIAIALRDALTISINGLATDASK